MNNIHSSSRAKKKFSAYVAALLMTLLVGFATLSISGNALLNHSISPLKSSPTTVETLNVDPNGAQQMQGLIAQYQAREQQYQARELQYQTREQQFSQELQQSAQQLSNANGQIQQYQAILMALQNAGVIRIDSNGQIFLLQNGTGGGENDG